MNQWNRLRKRSTFQQIQRSNISTLLSGIETETETETNLQPTTLCIRRFGVLIMTAKHLPPFRQSLSKSSSAEHSRRLLVSPRSNEACQYSIADIVVIVMAAILLPSIDSTPEADFPPDPLLVIFLDLDDFVLRRTEDGDSVKVSGFDNLCLRDGFLFRFDCRSVSGIKLVVNILKLVTCEKFEATAA